MDIALQGSQLSQEGISLTRMSSKANPVTFDVIYPTLIKTALSFAGTAILSEPNYTVAIISTGSDELPVTVT